MMCFLLMVRKCYRPVPYHNWDHAFSVAHASYVMMTKTEAFEEQEVRARVPGGRCYFVEELASKASCARHEKSSVTFA